MNFYAALLPTRRTLPVFLLLFALALGVRWMLAAVIPGHPVDINNFYEWCIYVTRHGLAQIYVDPSIFCDYPPLYLLVLRGVGWFIQVFELDRGQILLALKLPAILADLLCAWLIYGVFRFYGRLRLALPAAALLLFHPVSIFESAIWGQIDSLTLVLQLGSILALLNRQVAWALVLTALNILVKPQGLVLLPLILLVACYERAWRGLVWGTVLSFGTAVVVTLPFTQGLAATFPLLWHQYVEQAALYPFSSANAFNIWGLTGLWLPDSRSIVNNQPDAVWFLQHRTWGLVLLAGAFSACLFYARRMLSLDRDRAIWLSAALLLVAFYLFPTRMHERYLFSGLFFLLTGAALNARMWWPFGLYSFTLAVNLFFIFPAQQIYLLEGLGHTLNVMLNRWNSLFTPPGIAVVIALNVGLFGWLFYRLWREAMVAGADSV